MLRAGIFRRCLVWLALGCMLVALNQTVIPFLRYMVASSSIVVTSGRYALEIGNTTNSTGNGTSRNDTFGAAEDREDLHELLQETIRLQESIWWNYVLNASAHHKEKSNQSLCAERKQLQMLNFRTRREMSTLLAPLRHAPLPVLSEGRWKPSDCRAVHRVAFIIAFRNRHGHLRLMLNYMIPLWKEQLLDFSVTVVEQIGDGLFNKGRLLNAGVEWVMSHRPDVNCIVFHDVDLLPQSGSVPYNCAESPRHLGSYFDKFRFTLYYDYLLGGVVAIRPSHFFRVNGWSNLFWNYGGEDDNFGLRVLRENLTINRPPRKPEFFYRMLLHKKRWFKNKEQRTKVQRLVHTGSFMTRDGYSQHLWRTVDEVVKECYRLLRVDVGPSPTSW